MGTKRRIGVKYCGGCNPTYERVEMIEKVRFRLGDQFFFCQVGDEEIEASVLVSGCPRACADQGLNPEKNICYSMTGEGGYDALIDWLTAVGKKGESK
jgi:hypothetical protein